jgi:uncharacterized membrane protein
MRFKRVLKILLIIIGIYLGSRLAPISDIIEIYAKSK